MGNTIAKTPFNVKSAMAIIKQNKMKITSHVKKEENVSQNQKEKQSAKSEAQMTKMLKNKILKSALITGCLY